MVVSMIGAGAQFLQLSVLGTPLAEVRMAGPCRPGHRRPFRCATTELLGRSVRRWAATQSSPGCWVQVFRRGTGLCRNFQRLDSISVRYFRNMMCAYVRNYRSRSAVPAAGSRQRYIVPSPWAWPDAPCRRRPWRPDPSIANTRWTPEACPQMEVSGPPASHPH